MFCPQCGSRMNDGDRFCSQCGWAAQTAGPSAGFQASGFQASATGVADAGISPATASILCYVPFVGWIMSVIVFASTTLKNNRTTLFHAFQGLYLFIAWLVLDWFLEPVFRQLPGPTRTMIGLTKAALLVTWIYTLIQTANRRMVRLPLLSEWADRSITERVI